MWTPDPFHLLFPISADLPAVAEAAAVEKEPQLTLPARTTD